MTRTMPLWGAVLSLGILWGSAAFAQETTPIPAASDSLDAAADSLTTPGDSLTTPGGVKPATPAPAAVPATLAPGAAPAATEQQATMVKVRHTNRMQYYFSLGLGSAYNYRPVSFHDSFDPSFGLRLAGGVTKYGLRAGVTFSYNFYFSNGPTTIFPDDLNILTIFGDLKYLPLKSAIRPYVLVCGGYFRSWIINADYVENVLGYGGGAGVELEIDKRRVLFLEARYVQGQTRQTENQANLKIVPVTLGVTWMF